ncbi:MAG: Lrp/AsnC family transcriptional regulator [archaeon]
MKIKKKDLEILYQLDKNCRVPQTILSKKLKISRQTLNQRIKMLENEKIIYGYYLFLNIDIFNLITYRIYFKLQNISLEQQNKIISYLKKSKASTTISCQGKYNINIMYQAKNTQELHLFLSDIKSKFSKQIKEYKINNFVELSFCPRAYLINKTENTENYIVLGEKLEYKLKEDEIKLLNYLSKDASITKVKLSKELKFDLKKTSQIIRNLEKNKVIKGYKAFIDIRKLGYNSYKLFIDFKTLDNEKLKRFKDFCIAYPNIIYIDIPLGESDIEISVEIEASKFSEFIDYLRSKFKDIIKDIDYIEYLKEYKNDYIPKN